MALLLIPFSLVDCTMFTVKNWYTIGCEPFTISNNAATVNDVANDKSCAGIDANGYETLQTISLYFSQ